MSNTLAGKIALITGAGSGIGKATAELFAREGAIVIGVGYDIHAAVNGLPSVGEESHIAFEIDVSKEENIENMMIEILQKYKRPPSIVVNSAGISHSEKIVKIKEEHIDKVFNVNLKGTIWITKHVAKLLKEYEITNASIVNISSMVGKLGSVSTSHYAASKGSVNTFTKSAAMEFAKCGIRCNAILPGCINTHLVPDQWKDMLIKSIPLGRFGEAQEVADLCLFLASDKSSYITGNCIEITGGWNGLNSF